MATGDTRVFRDSQWKRRSRTDIAPGPPPATDTVTPNVEDNV